MSAADTERRRFIMAQAFPNSRLFGYDYRHAPIERAREAAQEAGVPDRITLEVASAKEYPGSGMPS